jgi:hypothetical protein
MNFRPEHREHDSILRRPGRRTEQVESGSGTPDARPKDEDLSLQSSTPDIRASALIPKPKPNSGLSFKFPAPSASLSRKGSPLAAEPKPALRLFHKSSDLHS